MKLWRLGALILLSAAGWSCSGSNTPPSGAHGDGGVHDGGGVPSGPLKISTASVAAARVGVAYTQALEANGGLPGYSWSVTAGALPTGLTLSTGGIITGTPTQPGSASFTVSVTDTGNNTASAQLSMVVHPPLLTIPAGQVIPDAIINVGYSTRLIAQGGTAPYTWSLGSGTTLPAGLTLSATGTISGTPTVSGTFLFGVQVADSSSPPQMATANFSLTVADHAGALEVTTQTLPGGEVGIGYNAFVAAAGGSPPYSWSIASGGLPPGLTLVTATGTISGIPTASGPFMLTVEVTDSAQHTAERLLTIVVQTQLAISTTALPSGVVGATYSATVATAGGAPPLTFALAGGRLPAGLSLNPARGVISGTPAAVGTSTFSISVTDSNSPPSTQQALFSVTVVNPASPLSVATTSLPGGALTHAYHGTLIAAGGLPPYHWTPGLGTVPPGLTIDDAGDISGAPTSTGTYHFTVDVRDSSGTPMTATALLSIDVVTALSFPPATLPGATQGVAYAARLNASGGTPAYTFTLPNGGLPNGLTLSPDGRISGAPLDTGVFEFAVQATDASSPRQTLITNFSITVVALLTITSTTLPAGLVGASYSAMLGAIGGRSPYHWTLGQGAPPGLTLDPATGLLSGTPSAPGSFNFAISISDTSHQTASQNFSVTVTNPPTLTITTHSLAGGIVGQQYTASLGVVGGVQPYSWTVASGSLPPGLSLSAAGLISGTPTNQGTSTFVVQVTDSAAPQNQTMATFSIAVANPIAITTTSLPPGLTAHAYSASLNVTGGTSPFTWSITSVSGLPPGLALNANTGLISGTPSAGGTFAFTAGVADNSNPRQRATVGLTITITPALVITSATLPNGTVGVAYSATVAVSGGVPPYAFALTSGPLPQGLTLDTGTGHISGTPTATGVSNLVITVTDHTGTPQSAQASYQVAINGAGTLTITTGALPSVIINTAYAATLHATGGTTPYTWSCPGPGALPPGVALDASTGAISGTPTSAGTFTCNYRVVDSSVPSQSTQASLSINVIPQLRVTTTSLPGGVLGSAYSASVLAIGGVTPYTWSASGSLPPGVVLDPNTGTLSGMPTSTGNFPIMLQVSDSGAGQLGQTASQTLSVIVTAPVSITPASFNTVLTGSPFSALLAASGGTTPYTWTVRSGSLPPGLSLTTAGLIHGTPTTPGTYPFTVGLVDSSNPSQSAAQMLQMVVAAPLAVVSTAAPRGTLGLPYTTQLTSRGGLAPVTWAVAQGSNLPAGLSLGTDGTLSGTPGGAGSFSFDVAITDTSTPIQQATGSISLVISPPGALSISTAFLRDGITGRPYTATLNANGGQMPYTWTVTTGALPGGLSLNASSGVISGSPTQTGTFNIVVQVSDTSVPQQAASRSLSITVGTLLQITTTNLPGGTQNQPYSATLTGSGGILPYHWSVNGMLPDGLTLNPASGTISGVPTGLGTSMFSVTLTDSSSPPQTATRPMMLVVVSHLAIDTTVLPPGTVNALYMTTLTASGGTTPYGWSIISGDPPPGLTLNAATGDLAGTPTASGSFSFTVRVTDAGHPTQQAESTLSVLVNGP